MAANLMIKRVDPGAAAEALTASVRDVLPTAGVSTQIFGTPEQPSLGAAIGHELGAYFRNSERTIFSVLATVGGARPLRIGAGYVPVGRGAGPVGVLYEARLSVLVPALTSFRRGRFRSGEFSGDPAVAGALAGVRGLGSTIWRFLQPVVIYNQTTFTIEPLLDLVPDDDGAVLVAYSAPARATFGLGGYRLGLQPFLDIAAGIETALAAAAGIRPAPSPNAPLPS
ncbi:MAG TPA: hypothetical protein VFJ71_05275 [Candidatus Limnocylindrales bacterium]|nr:hypothetical protein [Candidatus Limnocylindrales bacterium]